MNFTESFEQFSRGLQPRDLMLYAGVGLVLWVLFKDKMTPVQQLLAGLINKVKDLKGVKSPVVVPAVTVPKNVSSNNQDDIFFKLVVSWKQTRDLAEQSGCTEAIKVADQMFPYLSPQVCKKETV